MLQTKIIGRFETLVEGRAVRPLRSKRGEWLLALLTIHAGSELNRSWLASTLWPDSEDQQALGNLRRTLTDLRDALGDGDYILSPSSRTLMLDRARLTSDYGMVEHAVKSKDPACVRSAVSLVSDEIFGKCDEEWTIPCRADWHYLRSKLIAMALEDASTLGGIEETIRCLKIATAAEPYREHYAVDLMRAYSAQRDFAAALEVYRSLRLRLRDELAVEPARSTQKLYEEIRLQAQSLDGFDAPASSSVQIATGRSIPSPQGPLFGREPLLSEIEASLKSHRILTLVGPGGVGKTRLAIELGQRISTQFRGVFCDLAHLTVPEVVVGEIHRSLGIRERPSQGVTQALAERWGASSVLLIVDNCEHLVEPAAIAIAELVNSMEGLHVVATSREPLRLASERIVRVTPLGAGDEDASAEELFHARAKLVRKHWAPSFEESRLVRDICRRLDGLPLAIEFAAGQTHAMAVSEVYESLESQTLDVLSLPGGSNERQRTLVSTLDWSYHRISAEEQFALKLAAAVDGLFTFEDLSAIAKRLPTSVSLTRNMLTGLVEKSLLARQERSGKSAYRLLETTREYARRYRTDAPEALAFRTSYVDHFVDWAKGRVESKSAEGISRAHTDMEVNYHHLRAALNHVVLELKDAARGLELQLLLNQFWTSKTRIDEAWYWFQEVLRISSEGSYVASRTRMIGSLLAIFRGDRQLALQLAIESDRIATTLSHDELMYLAKIRLITAYQETEQFDRALELEPFVLATMSSRPTDVQLDVNVKLGILCLCVGRHEDSIRYAKRSHELSVQRGEFRTAAWCHVNEGDTYQQLRRFAEACDRYADCLRIMWTCQDRMGTLESSRSLGQVLAYLAESTTGRLRCIQIVSTIQSSRAQLPWFTRADSELHQRWREDMIASVGQGAFDSAWDRGKDDSIHDVIPDLLELATERGSALS